MYGKIVDGVLQNPPEEIRRSIQAMKDAGFKPVIDSKPGYDVETQDAILVDYFDAGAYIRAMYEIVEIEPTEEEQMIEQTNKAMELFNINFDKFLPNLTDEQVLVIPLLLPKWREGADYKENDRIRYSNKIYKVLQDHTSQEGLEPDVTPDLFEQIVKKVVGDNEQTEILEWEKRDIKNPYMKGDKVLYQGKIYVSNIDINLTTPGKALSGWQEVVENNEGE